MGNIRLRGRGSARSTLGKNPTDTDDTAKEVYTRHLIGVFFPSFNTDIVYHYSRTELRLNMDDCV